MTRKNKVEERGEEKTKAQKSDKEEPSPKRDPHPGSRVFDQRSGLRHQSEKTNQIGIGQLGVMGKARRISPRPPCNLPPEKGETTGPNSRENVGDQKQATKPATPGKKGADKIHSSQEEENPHCVLGNLRVPMGRGKKISRVQTTCQTNTMRPMQHRPKSIGG